MINIPAKNQFRIAYFVNHYPKVSHSFIRREILALERQGFEVLRIALRGWDAELVDTEDILERERTLYVLHKGMLGLVPTLLTILITRPIRFFLTLRLALKMSVRAERPWPVHLIYFAEACRILPWLDNFDAHHIHAHFGTNSAEIVMLAHELGGPPYSFTVHGQDELLFGGIAEKVSRSSFVVAISSYGRSQLFRRIKHTYWPKIKVVHCGLETAFHEVVPIPPPLVKRLVCVARLSAEKGHFLLIEAVHQLSLRNIKVELVLAGDGEIRAEVEALIKQHGLTNQVRITGWISGNQVREEILAASGLVLPSFTEGLPVVIMEAMALRRPVLASNITGIPELVKPGETGWLFPAGSIDELVASIEDFLSQSPHELLKMGDAAYKRVIARHSIDIESAKLAKLFETSSR